MVRLIHDEYIDGQARYQRYAGLASDTKPVQGMCTGSEFLEVDTGAVYFFDEEGNAGSEWILPSDS